MKALYLLLLLPTFLAKAQEIQLGIGTTGIYKIDANFLKKHAPALSGVPPENLRIRGGHPYVLPQENAANRTKGWETVPTQVLRTGDSWEICFYAVGGEENPYSASNFYFLSEGTPKNILQNHEVNNTPPQAHLRFRQRFEEDKTNLLHSGRLWLGDLFKSSYKLEHDYSHYHDEFLLKARFYPVGISRQFLDMEWGGTQQRDTLNGAPYHPSAARYERVSNAHDVQLTGLPADVNLRLSAESVGNAGVYLDYWEVIYRRKLGIKAGQIRYELDKEKVTLEWPSSTKKPFFWQVFSPWDSEELLLDQDGHLHPKAAQSALHAFYPAELPYPQYAGTITYPHLQSKFAPELLVVFPENFRREAEELIQYKREKEGLDILGVSIQDIRLEFSSGKTDPSAIRDFCRQLYLENPQKFKALLILGDASYDYRNIQKAPYVDPNNFVSTYTSRESLEPIYSYASDDYFGFLEEHEGSWPEGYSLNNRWQSTGSRDHSLDIAVGRIPARSRVELAHYIEKYKAYRPEKWGRELAFVADNRDYNLHQQDARSLEGHALKNFPGYRTRSLYLDAFPVKDGASPEANARLHELLEEGTFLMTYIGHGAEDGWTNEKLLGLADIMALKNEGRLPIFLTATCAFGRFDDPGKVSGAELLLLRPNAGAMALLSTTRPVYSSTNQVLNEAFFTHLSGSLTLGEAFRKTKNQSIRGEINRNFSLLGDPTLVLPRFDPNPDLHLSSESFSTLEKIQLSGRSIDFAEGWVELTLLDAPAQKKTLGTFEDGPAFTYFDASEELVKARFPVQKAFWEGTISLPRSHRPGPGRLLITYINSEDTIERFSGKEINYLQTSPQETGLPEPEITAQLTEKQEILFHLRDKEGLSLQGMRVFINEKEIKNPGQYYHSNAGSIYATLLLPLALLPNGKFTVTIIGADIYNNVNQKTFPFEINRESLRIKKVLTHPNPAVDFLFFSVDHNREGDRLEGSIRIFDAQGREKAEIPVQCSTCKETVRWTIDVQQLGLTGEKGYYKLTLKSASTGDLEKSGGILFFWK
jgi:hypothetical protein